MKALAFGEILWDIIEGKPHLGGAPLNFIAHMAQYGVKPYIISRVGSDEYGEIALVQIASYGVDTSLIQQDEMHETGSVDVTLINGQPDYIIKKEVAYDFIEFNDLGSRLDCMEFDVFYFGSLAQRSPVSADTLKTVLSTHKFKHVFYDVNLRKEGYSKMIIMSSLRLCDILKLNIQEVSEISEVLFEDLFFSLRQFCDIISEVYSIKIIIITAAERGCYVFEENNFVHVPGHKIDLQDAVGAGDAFSASFMYEYLKHGNVIEAATKANKIGAYVASQIGPIPQYTSEVLEILDVKMRVD